MIMIKIIKIMSTAITSPVLIVKPDGFCCIACLVDVPDVILELEEGPCGIIGAVFHGEGLSEGAVFPEKACGVEVGTGVYALDVCEFCGEVVTT